MSYYISRINWVDIIILILLARTAYVGLTQGLSYEVLTLVGIIGAGILAIHNYEYLGDVFVEQIGLPVDFSNFISFLILSIGTLFLCIYIRNFFYRIVKLPILPRMEKFGGLIFGFIRGCLAASLILLSLVLVPSEYIRTSIQEKSLVGMFFLKIAPACYEYSLGLFPKYNETKKSRITEKILTHEPSEKEVESRYKKEKAAKNIKKPKKLQE